MTNFFGAQSKPVSTPGGLSVPPKAPPSAPQAAAASPGQLDKRDLESGKAKLDDAVRAYERGAALKAHCEAKLAGAKAKIEQITVGSDGKVSLTPFDAETPPPAPT